jgi:class 3 adenylate cyclase
MARRSGRGKVGRRATPDSSWPQFATAVILFADLVGSSQLSEFVPLDEFGEAIRSFHRNANDICKALREDEMCRTGEETSDFALSTRGDEVCVVWYRLADRLVGPTVPRVLNSAYEWGTKSLFAAFKLALALKASWLLSRYNLKQRILRGRLPLDLAVGIHIGSVGLTREVPRSEKLKISDFFGYSLNLAKRVEGAGRDGEWTSIMVSPEVHYLARTSLPDVIFHVHPPRELKGILVRHGISEVREILFSDSFRPAGWRLACDVRPWQDVRDGLDRLVECHVGLPGLRFMSGVALQFAQAEGARTALTSRTPGLLEEAIKRADELKDLRNPDWDRPLRDNYESLVGHPDIEARLRDASAHRSEILDKPEWRGFSSVYHGGARRYDYISKGQWVDLRGEGGRS